MITTLILKEIRSVLLSPKFGVTLALCTVLMLLSVYLGIREFRSAQDQFTAANSLVEQEMREARQWMVVNNRVYREPDPLQIFASGIQNDIGRYSSISSWEPVKLVHSAYSDDPIFAVFRFIDVSFIIQVVLTLLAILFTFDAINGERENGTLQLIFSNAVPRVWYIGAKLAGTWLGLVVPLLVPVLLSVVLVMAFGITFTADQWGRLAGFFFVGLLLVTFFAAFGVLMSALTGRSNASFLLCLVSWVAFVLVLPRVGVMAAGQVIRVPTVAEMENQQESYENDRWKDHMKDLQRIWKSREESMAGLSQDQRRIRREEMEWAWAEEDDVLRKKVQVDIDRNARLLKEEVRNRMVEQERLAALFCRVSPVCAFQFASMNLCGTDIGLKSRYEDALTTYRTGFNEYKNRKAKETGGGGGLRITVDTETGIKIDTGREIALDLTGIPRFEKKNVVPPSIAEVLPVDVGLLFLFIVLSIGGSVAVFARYDVR